MEHLPAPVKLLSPVPPPPLSHCRHRFPRSTKGRIDIVPGAQFSDTSAILRIFSLMATNGYTLSQAAEDRITDALPALAFIFPKGPIFGTPCAKCCSAPTPRMH